MFQQWPRRTVAAVKRAAHVSRAAPAAKAENARAVPIAAALAATKGFARSGLSK